MGMAKIVFGHVDEPTGQQGGEPLDGFRRLAFEWKVLRFKEGPCLVGQKNGLGVELI